MVIRQSELIGFGFLITCYIAARFNCSFQSILDFRCFDGCWMNRFFSGQFFQWIGDERFSQEWLFSWDLDLDLAFL
jgi:hypothetical protein